MVNRRFRLSGLLAVLLALMAQLGAGAAVPRIDPVAAADICHGADKGQAPADHHPLECPACPLCTATHVQAPLLVIAAPHLADPATYVVLRTELPPPATAPPPLPRPPSQPRAPPTHS